MEISGSHVEKQYFTLEEANSMIPYLKDAFVRIIQIQTHIEQTYWRLEEAGFAPDSEIFEVEAPGAPTEVLYLRASLLSLIESIREELDEIHERGALVKGLERGLVDWYAERDGEDIFLCWELGEDEVEYWHPVEDGYQGRRPVEEL